MASDGREGGKKHASAVPDPAPSFRVSGADAHRAQKGRPAGGGLCMNALFINVRSTPGRRASYF